MIYLSFPQSAPAVERDEAHEFVSQRLSALGPVVRTLPTDKDWTRDGIRYAKGLVYYPLETGGIDADQARDLLEARLYGKKIWALNRNVAYRKGAEPKRWFGLNGNSSRTIPPFLTVEETRRLNQKETADA